MPVTMKDVAEHCGVSCGAVSQVLKDPDNPRFTFATRQKIIQAASELNYRRNMLSEALRSNKSRLIGVLYPWNCPEIIDSLEQSISMRGYKMMPMFTPVPRPGREKEILESFLEWNVDGIIWEPSFLCHDCEELLQHIHQNGPPLIFIEHRISGLSFPLCSIDVSGSFDEAAKHAAAQGYTRGHTFLTPEQLAISGQEMSYLHQQFIKNGLEFSSSSFCGTDESFSAVVDEAITRYADGKTMFFVLNSFTPLFVDIVNSRGLKIPQDLGYVLLFDMLLANRFRLSNILSPKSSNIRLDFKQFSINAVDFLFELIDGKADMPSPAVTKTQFIAQQSTTRRFKH